MATPWRADYLPNLMRELTVDMDNRARIALAQTAAAVEKQAKINASNGTHALGTKTPAMRGEGPAIISGTLRRSIVHLHPIPVGMFGWETRVGMAAGVSPPYKSSNTSSRYAMYLETRQNYPFLLPAFHFVMASVMPVIWRTTFQGLGMGPIIGRRVI